MMAEAFPKSESKATTARSIGDRTATPVWLENLTPAQIVSELDRFIIGQNGAKRAVAVALRNRYRRQLLPDDLRSEVQPRNILMIGPTGVGKTEIARRVARMVEAPFIKVEATKFTEVGYVGRDVESIIRDLVEVAISQLHNQRLDQVQDQADQLAAQRLVDLVEAQLFEPKSGRNGRRKALSELDQDDERLEAMERRRRDRQRKRLLRLLREHALDEETVEIEIDDDVFDDGGYPDWPDDTSPEGYPGTIRDLLDSLIPRRSIRRRVPVREARKILAQQEAIRLVDLDLVIDEAIVRVEENGVVFLDEIDKTISLQGDYGGDVSGEGVQRDLLPIVEGSVVMTRYGPVRTDHILFIAAGSFHNARPSDLIPEIQGRFPIRVELNSLTEDDLFRILTEPENALTRQYQALLATEQVEVQFTEDGLREMASMASDVNGRTEDIGARRLQTIIERVVEDISFDAPGRAGESIVIDTAFVRDRVETVVTDDDLSQYIL